MGDERLNKIPADLDLKPYRDEHDTELLQRMAKSVAKGEHPPGVDKDALHAKIKSHIAHLASHAHSAKAGSGASAATARKTAKAPVMAAAARTKKPASKKAPAKRK